MDPWYKVATPRKEVREGRSFNPDEFAIALEQVVAGTAPDDYKKPDQFFARTSFTRALRENSSLVLRRLAGETQNTAPVQTLVTQMGGGKTHMLTTLWHLANAGSAASTWPGVADLLREAGLSEVPSAKVAVFVGNAWDPQPDRETPWIDVAQQLAGAEGVKALGPSAKNAPPGTETINRVVGLVNRPVLLLFDELLNFFNRHRAFAEPMHAFLHNIVRGFIGTSFRSAVVSLPRSQVEMTDWDQEWQDKIVKVVGAVAKPLLVNDESEISEVVRRRLFQDLGSEKIRKNVAKAFSDWCFERRERLPREWTAVDSAATEAKAREFLQQRFEACYPFHPATLSVFQRKWQGLPQYQQTRGTLAMLAQWISIAAQDAFRKARTEPLITLGSAPLWERDFRNVVLGQLGESRLGAAIDADIVGEYSHAKALDADTKGPLREIHRRVAIAILFESSGAQTDKVARLPELRFAIGEPEVDTTSVDTAAIAFENRSYFVRKAGSDGFRIGYQPTMKKVVNDRRASLDEETEIKPAQRKLVEDEFRRGVSVPLEPFPKDGAEIPDSPRLTLVIADPSTEWLGTSTQRAELSEWMRKRGNSPRLYPGALVWCFKKPGRDLRENVELALAWKRVAREIADGTLGGEFDRNDRAELQSRVKDAEEGAKDEVWGGYRFIVVTDSEDADGIKVVDLGAGHSSAQETLCGRVIHALKSSALLNESVGAGYLDRNWPPALKESGAWPLSSLRQSFLNGSLTRLLDPDAVLKAKIVEFVGRGDFGLASGNRSDGNYDRLWFEEPISSDEVNFDANVFLITKGKAKALRSRSQEKPNTEDVPTKEDKQPIEPEPPPTTKSSEEAPTVTLNLQGSIPPEIWNRLGTKLIPKLRSGSELKTQVIFSVLVDGKVVANFESELRQILDDLGLADKIRIDKA
jgi:hypothetical protein